MKAKNGSSLTVLLAVSGILVLPLAIYVGAYFALCQATTANLHSGGTCRVYRSMWLALAFMPAALIESATTGGEVSPAWTESGS